jgi:hypothetical protein
VRLGVVPLYVVAAMAAIVGLSTPALARSAGENLTVEQLLTSGWQVVGFASAAGSRAALVLFRHPTETYLVQCLTGYDVTRTPRVFVSCYELH